MHNGLNGRSIERNECFTFVVSTPFAIRLSAKGAAIDVMTIEPKGGRTDTYRKKMQIQKHYMRLEQKLYINDK